MVMYDFLEAKIKQLLDKGILRDILLSTHSSNIADEDSNFTRYIINNFEFNIYDRCMRDIEYSATMKSFLNELYSCARIERSLFYSDALLEKDTFEVVYRAYDSEKAKQLCIVKSYCNQEVVGYFNGYRGTDELIFKGHRPFFSYLISDIELDKKYYEYLYKRILELDNEGHNLPFVVKEFALNYTYFLATRELGLERCLFITCGYYNGVNESNTVLTNHGDLMFVSTSKNPLIDYKDPEDSLTSLQEKIINIAHEVWHCKKYQEAKEGKYNIGSIYMLLDSMLGTYGRKKGELFTDFYGLNHDSLYSEYEANLYGLDFFKRVMSIIGFDTSKVNSCDVQGQVDEYTKYRRYYLRKGDSSVCSTIFKEVFYYDFINSILERDKDYKSTYKLLGDFFAFNEKGGIDVDRTIKKYLSKEESPYEESPYDFILLMIVYRNLTEAIIERNPSKKLALRFIELGNRAVSDTLESTNYDEVDEITKNNINNNNYSNVKIAVGIKRFITVLDKYINVDDEIRLRIDLFEDNLNKLSNMGSDFDDKTREIINIYLNSDKGNSKKVELDPKK